MNHPIKTICHWFGKTGKMIEIPNIHTRATAFVFILLLSLTFPAALVYACRCNSPGPGPWFIGPQRGDLPVNAAGVAFWYYSRSEEQTSGDDLAASFVVEILDQGKFRELPAKVSAVEDFPGIYVVAPQNGLEPGAAYRFTAESLVEEGFMPERVHERVHVIVDEGSLLSGKNLYARLSEVFTDRIGVAASGICSSNQRAAIVEIEAGAPFGWEEQLLYLTLVDGEAWFAIDSYCQSYPPGRSWQETTSHDLVYTACEERENHSWRDQGVESGRHTVKMQAFLPGTDVVLESDEFTVDLRCK